MSTKENAKSIVFLLFELPFLVVVILWAVKASFNIGNIESIQEGTGLLVEAHIPWWLGILEWLSKLPSGIVAFVVIGFLLFLKWTGEIR